MRHDLQVEQNPDTIDKVLQVAKQVRQLIKVAETSGEKSCQQKFTKDIQVSSQLAVDDWEPSACYLPTTKYVTS